jgi:lipopolysaccharide biosynthesis glycosyltransferase
MNKNLVLTISTGDIFTSISKFTNPTIQKYAKKINADFISLDKTKSADPKWEKMEVYNLFNKYNRIILLDNDLIIRDDCPNLFDIVSDKELGALNEKKYFQNAEKIKLEAQKYKMEIKKITNDYYNTGVLVLSRMHKSIFKPINTILGDFNDYFNAVLQRDKIKMFDLEYKFNRIHYQDNFVGIPRHDSYIIHYAQAPDDIMLDLIPKDLEIWKRDKPEYKYDRNIMVSVSAGMGDQLCSEPAIRYMKKIYKDSKIHIVTHFPRLFEHLKLPVYSYEKWEGLKDPVLKFHTCPDDEISGHNLSHALFHPTDFASLSMYRKTIPNIEKNINLKLDADDVYSVMEMVKDKKKDKPLVLVHAGKWWPSKTLPLEWWQQIADKLSEKLTVGLIGKTLTEEQGYLPVILPDDGYDFRDITSLGELIALISLSNVLLTNDSSPLHIAGAFDNWIVTIPTCKHPDHILPYRNGSQTYKTKALYKKLLLDDLEVRHTEPRVHTIDQMPEGKTMYDYIPDVDEVVSEIFKLYGLDGRE